MKKFINFFIGIVMIISGTTIITYNILSSGDEVNYKIDNLSNQIYIEEYFDAYGYTFNNPNVVLNPYGISPLTALIMFNETIDGDIKVTIKGKDNNDISYKVKGSKNNYIPIYGLYASYNNEIILEVGKRINRIFIKTGKIDDIDIINNYKNRDFTFVNKNDYVYMVDNKGNIRWYINNYGGRLDCLDNGHFLLHTDRKIGNGYYTGLVEIDMLGKIYYEYTIDNGGYGNNYVLYDNNAYILSDEYINYISLLNGKIIKSYKVEDNYDYIDLKNEKIIASNGNKSIEIVNDEIKEIDNNYKVNNIYFNEIKELSNYKLVEGVRFDNSKEEATISKRIWLFNYDILKNKDVNIYKEVDRLVVFGNFDADNVNIILDGIKGKKIYKMDNNEKEYYKYISNKGLKGKYSIYFEIDGNLYKSNYFVKF